MPHLSASLADLDAAMAGAALVVCGPLSAAARAVAAWETLSAVRSARDAGRTMVDLLALTLAHDQGGEADLAGALDVMLDDGKLPDVADLRARFMPARASIPSVHVELPEAGSYDRRLTTGKGMAA